MLQNNEKMDKFVIKILIFFIFTSLPISAYSLSVKNVRVSQEGKLIVINYDLDEAAMVDLSISINHGTYSFLYNHKSGGKRSKSITGDVGYVKAGKDKEIIWEVLKDYETFIYDDVRFLISPNSLYSGNKSIILANYGFSLAPQHSFGIMVGQVYKQAGWYLGLRSNYTFPKNTSELVAIDGGHIPTTTGDITPFYSGKYKNSHLVVNVGTIWDILNTASRNHYRKSLCGLYAGIGYGQRIQWWELQNAAFVQSKDNSVKGFSSELGIIGAYKGFTLSFGVNAINFKYLDLSFGVGWTIAHKNR